MEYIDVQKVDSKNLNNLIRERLKSSGEVTIQNTNSLHNIATGLQIKGKVIIDGSTGFYVGGFLEGSTVIVKGNAGWYAGDNMMDGELIIENNTGCNAGAYLYGGTMVIRGGTGSRVGYGMKGGTIIVCGSAGRWAGQMTLGGKLIILGTVGDKIGESMYKGVIYVKDEEVENKLGGNVYLDKLKQEEIKEIEALFKKYEIDVSPKTLKAIRPSATGRHSYTLFNPQLKPELSRKFMRKKGEE